MAGIPDWAPPWWYPWHPWYQPSLIPTPVTEQHYEGLAHAAADLAVGLARENARLREAATLTEEALCAAKVALQDAEKELASS